MFPLVAVRRKRQSIVENSLLKNSNVKAFTNSDTLTIEIHGTNEGWYTLPLKEVKAQSVNIICEANSFLQLIVEEFKEMPVTINLENNAELHLNFLALTAKAAGKYHVIAKENAKIVAAMADLADEDTDYEMTFDLVGNNATSEWHLASLSAGTNKKIFNINFNHEKAQTIGYMSNYGVVEDAALLHFKGISHIKNKSINSKTHQSAKIMVFDPKCKAKANPILKIDENNIEASHAAIVGRVNDDHMFYLQSRGISETDAKQLITLGYLKPITNFFADDFYKEKIIEGIEKRL